MRPFEIAILVVLLGDVVLRICGLRARWLPALALLLVGVHVVVEGQRWQMWPAYGIAVVLAAPTLKALRERGHARARWNWSARGQCFGFAAAAGPQPEMGRGGPLTNAERSEEVPRASAFVRVPSILVSNVKCSRGRALMMGSAELLLLAGAAFVPAALPVPHVPDPTGPFAVGTATFRLVDGARAETYSSPAGGPRELMVQFWYPADPTSNAPRAPYLEHVDIIGPALAESVGLPGFFLSHVNLARTPALSGADISTAQDAYPLIVFSHGWTSIRSLHTSLGVELASRGYVVAGVDHPYGAGITVFPDGRAVFVNTDALPFDAPDDELEQAAHALADVWAGDVQFVLDHLAAPGDDALPFAGRLDMEHVGIAGHSTGGGTTLEVCARDSRCKAALAMDAWFPPVTDAVLASGIPQPVLFMRSEVWSTAKNDALYERFRAAQQTETYELTIRGTQHYDFTDAGLLSPFTPALGLRKGPLDAKRGILIVNSYATAFFDAVLKGEPSPLLAGPSADYPEVDFEHR